MSDAAARVLRNVPARMDLPARGELSVWWAALPADGFDPASRAELDTALDEGTLARLARFVRPLDADRGRLGHALLRRLVAAALGVEPAGVRFATTCVTCGSTGHGKPRVVPPGGGPGDPSPVEVNLSHSGGLVAVALAPRGLGVGVDVEQDRQVSWPALRRSVFDDTEWSATGAAADPVSARFDAWSRKEAALKATGDGLAVPLPQVSVTGSELPRGDWRRVLVPPNRAVLVRDLPELPGGSAAVAVVAGGANEEPAPPRVTVHAA